MSYRNRFDRNGESSRIGACAEDFFEKIALSKNLKIQKATLKQQLSHIDFILTNKENKSFFIDVKARKRVSRYTDSFTDQLVWIELKNVQGNEGWLYGAADFIAFEREKDFVIVPRKNLVTICNKLISSKVVEKSTDALYCKFSRKTRKDELSLIKMEDILKNIKTSIWQK
jgi:hypothetical protein